MSRAMRKPVRELGMLIALGTGTIAACSVDTSDIRFVPDSLIDDEAGGGTSSGAGGNDGAVGNTGASTNLGGNGGSTSKAGMGNGGSSTAGSKLTGGSDTGGMDTGGMGTGGMGTGGMPPMSCTPGVADPTQGEIDNLDDGDAALPPSGGRHGGWYVYNDGTGIQMPGPNMPLLPEMGGAMATPWAMHTRGGPFMVWGAGLGIVLNGYPDKPPCTYDVRPQAGLRFWARGMNSNMILRVALPTAETQALPQGGTCVEVNPNMPICGDHYGFSFPLSGSWQQLQISWNELGQNGWGKVVPLNLEHVINIEFTVLRNVQFDFWIDQVAFY